MQFTAGSYGVSRPKEIEVRRDIVSDPNFIPRTFYSFISKCAGELRN